jgi:hypothetical protein
VNIAHPPGGQGPAVLKAGPADLVALTFYQLGYRPRESLLVVGVHGPRRRLGVVSRVDLPPARLRRQVVGQQIHLLRREQEDAVIALVVSDAAPRAASTHPVPLPHRPLAREFQRQAVRAGLAVVDVLGVGATSWQSYKCTGNGCCPPGGHSLADALNGPAAAQMVALGHVLADDEPGLVADVEPSASTERPARVRSSRGGGGRATTLAPEAAVRALARWRELLQQPEAAAPEDIAELTEVLRDRTLRDAMLLALSPHTGDVPEAVLLGAEPPDLDEAFGAEPDADLLERGRVLLSAVARSAPPGRRADALALLAWSAWWAGQGTRGRLLAARALADEPGHRLALLVDRVLEGGVAPPWAERRREARGRAASLGRAGGRLTGS